MNNEQEHTRVLSIWSQIQLCSSIFTVWSYDLNCLKKPHNTKRTDHLGTPSVLSTPQKPSQLCSMHMEAGTSRDRKDLYIMSALGHAAESDLIQQGLLTRHIASPSRAAALCTMPQCRMAPALSIQVPRVAQMPSRAYTVGSGPSSAWGRAWALVSGLSPMKH